MEQNAVMSVFPPDPEKTSGPVSVTVFDYAGPLITAYQNVDKFRHALIDSRDLNAARKLAVEGVLAWAEIVKWLDVQNPPIASGEPKPFPAQGSMDAVVWADTWLEYVNINPAIAFDKGTVIGWFANAIMAGWDANRSQQAHELTAHFNATFYPTDARQDVPWVNTPARRLLNVKLIGEEFMEFAEASGYPVAVLSDSASGGDRVRLKDMTVDYQMPHLVNLVEMADANTDIRVVNDGAAYWNTLPVMELDREVFESNMSKTDDGTPSGNPLYHDGTEGPVGKIKKGPYFRKPDIAAVLARFATSAAEPLQLVAQEDCPFDQWQADKTIFHAGFTVTNS